MMITFARRWNLLTRIGDPALRVPGTISVTCCLAGVLQRLQELYFTLGIHKGNPTLSLPLFSLRFKNYVTYSFVTWPKITVKRNRSEPTMRKNKTMFLTVQWTRERKRCFWKQWQDDLQR